MVTRDHNANGWTWTVTWLGMFIVSRIGIRCWANHLELGTRSYSYMSKENRLLLPHETLLQHVEPFKGLPMEDRKPRILWLRDAPNIAISLFKGYSNHQGGRGRSLYLSAPLSPKTNPVDWTVTLTIWTQPEGTYHVSLGCLLWYVSQWLASPSGLRPRVSAVLLYEGTVYTYI